jgi:hypothetical protein
LFCPHCKAEYRPGFTRCADCEVDLVEHVPDPRPVASDDPFDVRHTDLKNMKHVWSADERDSPEYVCAGLNAAGIPFKVIERKEQVYGRSLDEHYEIFVPKQFYEKAKIIAEQGNVDFTDSPEDQKIMGLPNMEPSAEHHDNERSWRPEDATVEVLSEKAEELDWFEPEKGNASMVEMSLKENGIGFRLDVEGGFHKIFVRPEHEPQAREIVREIKSGTPPP